jgi:hypothetical protein
MLWLEVLKAINQCLPYETGRLEDKIRKDIELRNELHISGLECAWTDNLQNWFAKVRNDYQPAPGEKLLAAAAPAPRPGPGQRPGFGPAAPAGGGPPGLQGPGYVLMLTGCHYHNRDIPGQKVGAEFVRRTLIDNLQTLKVVLPKGDGDHPEQLEAVTLKQLGVSYPVLVNPGRIEEIRLVNPNAPPAEHAGGSTPDAAAADKATIPVKVFKFTVQMAWQPTPPSKRHEPKLPQSRAHP